MTPASPVLFPGDMSTQEKELPTPKGRSQSQLVDFLFVVAESLGLTSDREIATLADVSPENVANWRNGGVKEFKLQTLETLKTRVSQRVSALRGLARDGAQHRKAGLFSLEIEEGSGPTDLQRQLRDGFAYDYLGHRFLYFDPQGALAWETLIGAGYDQDTWLRGVDECAVDWLGLGPKTEGRAPLAEAMGLARKGTVRALDIVSLGPGEGSKEARLLSRIREALGPRTFPSLVYAPVDVSIPLLMKATRLAHDVGWSDCHVMPFCADFEEGRLAFNDRLPSTEKARDTLRLVLLLGNTFGNLRDEGAFVRQRLWPITQPGDLVWVEAALRPERIEDDPLFRMTLSDIEGGAYESSRKRLLEGPYRRWEANLGRRPSDIDLRIWLRVDDETCRVPDSVNFCHDLVLREERRSVTMLYSRRYPLDSLTQWWRQMQFSVERVVKVADERGRYRVAHLLLKRK